MPLRLKLEVTNVRRDFPGKSNERMIDLSISEAAELLRQKKISPVDLTNACLDRIERLNPVLNAFITVTHESAMAQARLAEDEIHRGQWRGPLHGIQIGRASCRERGEISVVA